MAEKKSWEETYKYQIKYQESKGLITKSYKLNKELVENFKKACEIKKVSQAQALTELMTEFIEENNEQ